MTEFEEKSHLKDALIKKSGNYCYFCGKTDRTLQIAHILGQGEIEKEYFTRYSKRSDFTIDYEFFMFDYYNRNFDDESKFIGLVCNDHSVTHSKTPKLEDVISLVGDSLQNNTGEIEYLTSNYPHTMPFLERFFRLMNHDMTKFHSNNFGNGNTHDNLGEGFGR